MNAERFPNLDEIQRRWVACWDMDSRLFKNFPASEQLDRSLVVFLARELEDDDNAHEKSAVLGAALAAVTRSGTHSKEALQSSFSRIMAPPKKRFIDRADSKTKRLFLVATPVVWLVTIALVIRDVDASDYLHFTTILLIALSACLPIAAFTKVTDWINEN